MTVEFALLGDVEARHDGRRLDIGHARQRCVLVALLVDVNRPIPADQLVDRVWADQPPRRARNALAGYVSRLRSLFAEAEDVVIGREPGGYMLATERLSVDLHRFRQLASEGRASEDPLRAADLLGRALQLWRGEPFADLDTPWINDLRTVLAAERLSVVLDRNDAALRVGRHGDLLAELAAELKAHPLDERLAGQLMVAQYRSGRRADALDTYRQMRERLVEELGIDPSTSLRRVHQQILDGELADGVAEPAARPPEPSPVPHLRVVELPHSGLPRRASSFVGHADELLHVSAALRNGPLVTLTGVGGVGKTRLALEVASRDQDRFGDGAWICELAPLDNGEAVAPTVAATLRLQQLQGNDIEKTVIEYLRARELLLVVDNCEHVLEAAARLLERIVQHCPRVSVLATSREPLGIDGERVVIVPPLPMADATRLFEDRARASRPDFSLDHEPVRVVAEICRRLDGLPLAIELAAARMRVMSFRDLGRRLDRMQVLRGGAHSALPRQRSLAATIEWSYRLLTASERSLFVRLSVFVGGFDLEAAHGVCGADGASEDETLDALSGLVDKSMVIVSGGTDRTRYGLLESLRAFARDRLKEKGLDDQYAKRHAAYYAELAQRGAAGLQGADEQEWSERILPDYDNLRAAFKRAVADRDIDLALRLVASLPELVHLRIFYETTGWAERLVELADPDHPLFAAVVGEAARTAWNRGDFSRARQLAALAKGRVPGRGTARTAYPADVLADVALWEGDAQGAQAYWAREMSRARRDGDPIRLVWTEFEFALAVGAQGNADAALPVAREAVDVAEKTGNPTARAIAYLALGSVLKKSEPDRALALFDDAAKLAGAVQNIWWYGIAMMEAASIREERGERATAARIFIEVLDHWERVGDWTEQWVSLRYIARLLLRLGAYDDALFLHCALVKAGKPPVLSAAQLSTIVDRLGEDRVAAYSSSADLSGAPRVAAVARLRSRLERLVDRAAAR